MTVRHLVFLCGLMLIGAGCGPKQPTIEPALRDDFANIVVMYHDTLGRTGVPAQNRTQMEPSALAGFQPTLDRMKSGQLVIVWETPVTKTFATDSTAILAFERAALERGGFVQMVDAATTRHMTAAQLKAALPKGFTPSADGKASVPSTKASGAEETRRLQLFAGIYHRACNILDRPPRDRTELHFGAGTDAEQKASLDAVLSGKIVCVYDIDIRKLEDKDSVLLAYSKDVPTRGGRVVSASGEVKTMSAAEFKMATMQKK